MEDPSLQLITLIGFVFSNAHSLTLCSFGLNLKVLSELTLYHYLSSPLGEKEMADQTSWDRLHYTKRAEHRGSRAP